MYTSNFANIKKIMSAGLRPVAISIGLPKGYSGERSYFIGIKSTWVEDNQDRKIFISFTLSLGNIVFPLIYELIEFLLYDDNIESGLLFFQFYVIIFVLIWFFVIELPISLLSDRVAKGRYRWFKSLLVHIPLAFVILLIFNGMLMALFIPFVISAFPYWLLDELFRRKVESE